MYKSVIAIAVSKIKNCCSFFLLQSKILVFGILEICINFKFYFFILCDFFICRFFESYYIYLQNQEQTQTIADDFVQFTNRIYAVNKCNYLKMFSKIETFRYASKKRIFNISDYILGFFLF